MSRLNPGLSPAALAALAVGDLENALVASTPGGIEAQEAAGQATLVASQSLPEPGSERNLFEKLGFVFGEAVDELFVKCTLPKGWSKKATDHSMHSVVVDEQGRERVSVFYKAAFYDRRADMQLCLRYRLNPYDNAPESPDRRAVQFVDHDGRVVLSFGTYAPGDYATLDKLEKEARKELQEKYPDWRNPLAYWD